ncbi:MAG: hypothetical protein ACREDP_10440 [Bradyrhizobium sp.]
MTTKLAALGSRLGQSDDELKDVLSEISALPANVIVPASREIATAIRFGWWREQNGFLLSPLFGRASSTPQLLKNNADYAWLFLFHPSGYARETALDSIDTPPTSSFFFSALAWRLNDWVPPVRQAAERCVKRVLHRIAAEIAANGALYLLDRRLVWGRWSDEPEVLDSVFSREDVIAALAVQLRERSTGPLATCLRNTFRYPNVDEHLPRLAAAAVQPSVRAVAYQCLIFGKASWSVGFEWAWIDKVYGLRKRVPILTTRDVRRIRPAADLIREAVDDESPFVRRVAADALIAVRSQLPDEEALIARLANDPSSAIRSRADYMLRHPSSGQTS